jgi:3-oxoacyl-[acyl-carrier protein] reductase
MAESNGICDGKVAVVTGARRGIGLAIATRLYRDGASVVLFDVDEKETTEAARALDPSGRRVLAQVGDVSVKSDVQAMAAATLAKFGRIDILVNNAGISPKHAGKKACVQDMVEDEWRQVLDVNLTGAFLCTQVCLDSMKKNRWGRVVNIASQAARTAATIAGAHYAASKSGMLAFARTLATEVGADGITVTCVAPGRIVTPMAALVSDAANAAFLARIPVNRLGTPEDVAGVVAFLVSADASYVTGTVIDVNGGSFMG